MSNSFENEKVVFTFLVLGIFSYFSEEEISLDNSCTIRSPNIAMKYILIFSYYKLSIDLIFSKF